MSKKRVEREIRAAHRRNKKERQAAMEGGFDDFLSLNKQLGTLGLSLKQIPGDGNCLFRALGDQLDGQVQEHLGHREAVVRYMRKHRDDFEPFVEDDISFDDHLSSLSEQGTFGGNDAIVAWARLHQCTVVIHQLNKPLWQIHGGVGGFPGGWEVHISYHNGDHYNSVRRIGDDGGHGPPQRIRLCLASSSPSRIGGNRDICDNHSWRGDQDEDRDSGQESDYENHPGGGRLKKLAGEVSRMAGVEMGKDVFEALEVNRYCVTAAVDFLLNDISGRSRSGMWSAEGTGTRILGREGGRSPGRTAQEKLANIQEKLQNKNLSNKRRKELKKSKNKIAGDERKRKERRDTGKDDELVITNIQTLTI